MSENSQEFYGSKIKKSQIDALNKYGSREETKEAVALCLSTGVSLRDAALLTGVHFTTVREAIQRAGLTADWKEARASRLRRENRGKMPAVYKRHFDQEQPKGNQDLINNPAHYTEGRKIEPICVIEDWKLEYHLGQAIKYISRAGRKKGNNNLSHDLNKAIWYLQRRIRIEETEDARS